MSLSVLTDHKQPLCQTIVWSPTTISATVNLQFSYLSLNSSLKSLSSLGDNQFQSGVCELGPEKCLDLQSYDFLSHFQGFGSMTFSQT
ncbi:hypothetical protein E4T56_gene15361 [Termitomyces sp. T112]|nr:hypothetical protein E4T56_gene15361 [Termitomyces sp. T112]